MRRATKIALFSLLLVGLASATDRKARAAPAGLVEILAGFSAKESCSCAFVADQDDAYCKEFGQAGGIPVEVSFDRTAKIATAKVDVITRTAHVTEYGGCVLDPLTPP